jgi:cell division septation protein DedD
MTDSVQFVFSKQRLVALGLWSSLIGLLLFVAGIATGVLLHPFTSEPGRQVEAVSAERSYSPAIAKPEPTERSAGEHESPEDGNQSSQDGVIVDVASFPEKDRAANLASMLTREGFGPVHTGQYGMHGETLHYVRVGPFHDWDGASRVARQLDASFDLHTSMIPEKGGHVLSLDK